MKNIMQKAIEREVGESGVKMSKLISSGGLFSSDVYDNRIAYTIKEIYDLDSKGFSIDIDMGIFLLNAFMNYGYDKNNA